MDKPLVVIIGRGLTAVFSVWQREAIINSVFFALFAAGLAASLHLSQKRRKKAFQSIRQAEIALASSEALYRPLFDNMLNGFAYCQMLFEDGQPRDFIYLAVNKAFESQTGLQGVVGRKATEVVPGIRDADPGPFEIYGRVASTGRPEKFEMHVSALDMWFAVSVYCPERDQFVAVFDVITERKAAEVALRESESRYRMLTESIKDVVWVLDTETLYFRYVSPSVTRLRGYTVEEVLAVPVTHSLTDESAKSVVNLIERRRTEFRSGKSLSNTYYTDEVEQSCKDGSTVWTEVITSYYRNPESGHIEVRGVTRDIAERKRAEKVLRAREDQYKVLFERASDGIMILALSGKLVAVNQSFARMHGYTVEEMEILNLKDLDTPETFQLLPKLMKRILSGETITFEVEHYHRDGHIISLEVSSSLISTDNGTFVQAFHRDITERNRQRIMMMEQNALLTRQKVELEAILNRIKRLEGLLSICMQCKKIRTENNDWHQLERYIADNSDATFSHGLCPECVDREIKKVD